MIEITKHFDRYRDTKNDQSNPFYFLLKRAYSDSELIPPKEFNDIMLGDTLENKSFVKRLTGCNSIYELYSSFEDYGNKGYVNYAYMSEYLHWNPLRIGMYVKDDYIGLKELNSFETVMSLVIAYFVISANTKELSRHFELGKESDSKKCLRRSCQKSLRSLDKLSYIVLDLTSTFYMRNGEIIFHPRLNVRGSISLYLPMEDGKTFVAKFTYADPVTKTTKTIGL